MPKRKNPKLWRASEPNRQRTGPNFYQNKKPPVLRHGAFWWSQVDSIRTFFTIFPELAQSMVRSLKTIDPNPG